MQDLSSCFFNVSCFSTLTFSTVIINTCTINSTYVVHTFFFSNENISQGDQKKVLSPEKKVKYPTHAVTVATKIQFVTIGDKKNSGHMELDPTYDLKRNNILVLTRSAKKKQSCIPFLLKRLLALLPDKIKVTHRNLKQVSLNCQVF